VPAVGLKGYPAHNRIGYRIIAAAGGLVVAWYESDLRAFPTGDILSDGSGSNVGRAGFATAALSWSDDGKLTVGTPTWAGNVTSTTDLLRDPRWQYQLAAELAPVRGARWRDGAIDLWLAVSDGAGHILVGERASGGDWAWTKIGAGFKPVLAIDPGSGIVFLGWHAGSPIRNYYSLSADGGRTWTAPAQAGPAWGQPGVINGAGLRENAVYDGTSGAFVWAFGDGAKAARVIVIRP
jgi:hypothetical protein